MKKLICTILLGSALVSGNACAATWPTYVGVSQWDLPIEEGIKANPLLFAKESPELAAVPYFLPNCWLARDKTVSIPDDKREEASAICQNQETLDPYVVYIFDKSGNLLQKVGIRVGVEYGLNIAPGNPKSPLRLDAHAVEGIPSLRVPKGTWNIPVSLNTMLGKKETDSISSEENTFPKEGVLASVPFFTASCIAAKEGTSLKAEIKDHNINPSCV